MFDELYYDESGYEWVVIVSDGGDTEHSAVFCSNEMEDGLDKTKLYKCESEPVKREDWEEYGPVPRRVTKIGEVIGDRE